MRIRIACIRAALVGAWAAGMLVMLVGAQAAEAPGAQTQRQAQAREALVRYVAGRAQVGEVRASPVPGLFEAALGSDVVYIDGSGRYILAGDLIDTKQGLNLTETRRAALERIDWSVLPLEQAIKTTRGDGRHSMAVFADPNCGYCKRLESQLAQLDNVTVYTFVLPFLSPDSEAKAGDILCAPSPALAWRDWMISGTAPAHSLACAAKVSRLLELGRSHRIRSTPLMIFPDGSQLRGVADAATVEQKLRAGNT